VIEETIVATDSSPTTQARCEKLLVITKRLTIMTVVALAIIGSIFAVTLIFGKRFMVSWACFGCGLIGGFVSIQQRIKNVEVEELELLSRSWFQILLIPVYGGIFALVLYLALLSRIVEGSLFPTFSVPAFSIPPTTDDMKNMFVNTFPATGVDFAKLVFWCFVAGFSERLVPQIISTREDKSRS
jgi:hypothetical protein